MPRYECDECGACCRTFLICASQADADREPRIVTEGRLLPASQQTPGYKYKLHPLPFLDGCNFLADNRCTIYATRPTVCRQFAAGDVQCQMARDRHALPPLAPAESE